MYTIAPRLTFLMIEFLTREYSDKEIYNKLTPLVGTWFKDTFKTFSPPQKYAVVNIHNQEHTLISAPTGSGKTLSAFLSILNELVDLSQKDQLEDKIYCVYISPLKALNNDIFKNLETPLKELEERSDKPLNIRTAVRTGDTPTYERQKMLKTPPHILITTPESLAIILCSQKFRQKFVDVKWVIVDEVHALAPNKRGVHLSLSMERLQNLAGKFTRIGLSATISPIEEIAQYLVGYENDKPRDCKIVDVSYTKELDLQVISPVPNIIKATQQELHEGLYSKLDELIDRHKTTLIFTNTRSATERVVNHLKTKYPGKYDNSIGAHHSSLSKEHRFDIENRLRNGELKVVVCSTSLELGIDIGFIDLVILLGSPKSVARALQRVGRSGHRLHDKIKGRFIVMDRDDLVECSVILKNAMEKHIDKIQISQNCLDVLAQHIYGIAIEEKQHIENVYSLVKRSYCYNDLPREQFDDVISYLAGDYVDLEQRSVYAKIWYDKETKMMGKRGKLARVLYSTNIGTIPDEAFVQVKAGDKKIGAIDESFLERLKKGDIFVLGGNIYRFNFARGMTIQVTPTPGALPTVPSWFSEMLPLSFDLAKSIQQFRRYMHQEFEEKKSKKEIKQFISNYMYLNDYAINSLYEYFREQYRYAEIPHDKKMVIEMYRGFGDQKWVIVHSLYGRRVNDVLSRVLAYELAKRKKRNVRINLTDNGFALTSEHEKLQVIQAFKQFNPKTLRNVAKAAIDKSEVLKRRFRHCAGRSLMILRSYKGHQKSVGRQQVGSMILLSTVKDIDDNFPILTEARREVLEDLMDLPNAQKIIEDLDSGKIKVKVIATDIPSPFALNMIARGYTDILKMEDRLEFIRRMHQAIIKQIGEN